MTFQPRNGQWVLVDPDAVALTDDLLIAQQNFEPSGATLNLADAHRAANGHLVGIYSRGGKDARGQEVPAHVALVRANGCNLRGFTPATSELVQIALRPETLSLAPLLDNADLPPGRVVAEGVKLQP